MIKKRLPAHTGRKTGQRLLCMAAVIVLGLITSCHNPATAEDNEGHYVQYMLMTLSNVDQGKLKSAFDGSAAFQNKYKIQGFGFATAAKDDRTVTVFSTFEDISKVRDISNTPELKAILSKAGINTKPEIRFLYLLDGANYSWEPSYGMALTASVKDYDKCRKQIFDDKEILIKSGLQTRLVFHDIDKPDRITVMMACFDISAAQRMTGSPEFSTWLTKASITDAPDISFLEFNNKDTSAVHERAVKAFAEHTDRFSLDIVTTSDCYLTVGSKNIGAIRPGDIYRVPLSTGDIRLFFRSVTYPGDTISTVYSVRSNTGSGIYYADMQAVAHARVVRETSPKTRAMDGTNVYDMVLVSGGEFVMGNQNGKADEVPEHKVSLSSFYLSKYEITQNQWKEIMGTTPSHFAGCGDCPVENVSQKDALAFIAKVNAARATSGIKYRLPTEAEWEYAAHGGGKSQKFAFSGSNDLNEIAWWENNSDHETHPVGQKKPNELGLYDMTGNVFEWCSDWFSYTTYKDGQTSNPKGAASGAWVVIRGSSWGSSEGELTITHRNMDEPTNRGMRTGFRLAGDAVR